MKVNNVILKITMVILRSYFAQLEISRPTSYKKLESLSNNFKRIEIFENFLLIET